MTETLPFALPKEYSSEDFYALAPRDLWQTDPQKATIQALRRSGLFDEKAYMAANPDVSTNGIGAIEHYVKYGISEKRSFPQKSAKPQQTLPDDNPSSPPQEAKGDSAQHDDHLPYKIRKQIKELQEENSHLLEQLTILQQEVEKYSQLEKNS